MKGARWLMVIGKVQTMAVVAAASVVVLVPKALAVQMTAPGSAVLSAGGTEKQAAAAIDGSADGKIGDAQWLPAWTPRTDDEKEFVRVYGLDVDQTIKQIPRPWAPWRTAVLEQVSKDGSTAFQRRSSTRAQAYDQAIRGGMTPDAAAASAERTASAGTVQSARGGAGSAQAQRGAGGFIPRGGAGAGRGDSIGGAGDSLARGDALLVTEGPGAVLLGWRDQKLPQVRGALFRPDDSFSVSGLLMGLFAVGPDLVEGDQGLLHLKIEGDFVVRNGVTREKLRGEVEKMLSGELNAPVSLKFREVQVLAYVLRGAWKYQPLSGQPATGNGVPEIHLYSRDMEKTLGTSSGPAVSLGGAISGITGATVKIEATGLPRTIKVFVHQPRNGSDAKAILDHVAEQTGLTWASETQVIRHIVLERPKDGQ